MSPLLQKIEQAARSHRDATAFVYGGGSLNYAQWFALLCAGARRLHDAGIRPGDAVLVALGQSPLHCVALLALARLGALCVPWQPGLAPGQRAELARRYGIRWLLADRDDVRIEGLSTLRFDELAADPGVPGLDFITWQPQAQTPFRIALSSGTTGGPHGVMHTHEGVLDRIEKTALDCDAGSRVLLPVLSLTVGSMFALGVLCAGGTLVFPRSYELADLAAAMREHGVTHALFSPAAAQMLVGQLPPGPPAFPALRHLRIVGATPAPALLEQLRSRCSPNVFVPYGLTELGAISMATPEILAQHPRSAGHVLPWARVEIVDAQGGLLPAGSSGEIRVATHAMPAGYYRDEEFSAHKFRGGWFYPGDFGQLGADGLLHVGGRLDDVLNVGGRKVVAGEIEQALLQHPQVSDAAVFLLDRRGASLLAAAIVTPGGVPPDLAEFCNRTLGSAHTPGCFVVMPEFPRNAAGKLMRRELAQAAQTLLEAQSA